MDKIRNHECKGFTLIEVLLVVGIVGILAALVGIKTIGQADKAKRQAAWTQAATLKTAIGQFEMEVGRLPRNLEELVVEGDKNWPGPFLDVGEVPKDPWGSEFQMQVRGKQLRITSPGPDGLIGTDDDLWK
jgi:general secretion pathway protein G